MSMLSRRSIMRASLGLAAAGTLARPFIANAAATTATVWWPQGFIPQEDAAFRKLVADYEKASGNKIDYSIVPFAPLRQKFISAITSGVVPDLIDPAYGPYLAQQAWKDTLLDVTDLVDAQKANYSKSALLATNCYNSVTKKRGYYAIPWAAGVTPFHIWGSLVEKAGYKISDIPDKWDPFIDFFKPTQKKLRDQGMRHTYSYGFVVSTIGGDPVNTYDHFVNAYGGADIVTPDGVLHAKDQAVREAAIRAMDKLGTLYKDGYIPPGSVNWNDADDNNAFHAKLCVMDFDGTLSTELAMLQSPAGKEAYYHDVITHGLPLNNAGKPIPGFIGINVAVIPKAAKNIAAAKDFAKYFMQPEVNNEWLKGGLARRFPVFPQVALNDPWWMKSSDPHRAPYVKQGLIDPTIPYWYSYNPAWAQVESEHVFNAAMAEVFTGKMTPTEATDHALARSEAIFAKYPIAEG